MVDSTMPTWTDIITALAAFVAAIATAAYTVFTRRILRETASNTRITRQVFSAAHRPYVFVDSVYLDSRDLSVKFQITNHGSVPAVITERRISLALNGRQIPSEPETPPGVLFQGGSSLIRIPFQLEGLLSDAVLTVSLRYEGVKGQSGELYAEFSLIDAHGHFTPRKCIYS